MVGRRDIGINAPCPAARRPQPGKGLRAGHFVQQLTVEQVGAFRFGELQRLTQAVQYGSGGLYGAALLYP